MKNMKVKAFLLALPLVMVVVVTISQKALPLSFGTHLAKLLLMV